MTSPGTPPPPGGPSSPPHVEALDPRSPKGREVAARLTRTLAQIELEIAEREARENPERAA